MTFKEFSDAVRLFFLEINLRKEIFKTIDEKIITHVEYNTVRGSDLNKADRAKLKTAVDIIIAAPDEYFFQLKKAIDIDANLPIAVKQLRAAAAYAYAEIFKTKELLAIPNDKDTPYYYRLALYFAPNLPFVRKELAAISKFTGHSYPHIEYQQLVANAEENSGQVISRFVDEIIKFIPKSKIPLKAIINELNKDPHLKHHKPLIVKRLFDQIVGIKNNNYAELDLNNAINKLGAENIIYLLAQIEIQPTQVKAPADAKDAASAADIKMVEVALPTAISEAQKQQILINLLVSKELDNKHIGVLGQQIKTHFPNWCNSLHAQLIAMLIKILTDVIGKYDSDSTKHAAKKTALISIKAELEKINKPAVIVNAARAAADKPEWNFSEVNRLIKTALANDLVTAGVTSKTKNNLLMLQRALSILEPLRTFNVADHKVAPAAQDGGAAAATKAPIGDVQLSGVDLPIAAKRGQAAVELLTIPSSGAAGAAAATAGAAPATYNPVGYETNPYQL